MTIGTGLFLVAVGAILRYAVKDEWDVIDLPTVGLILMVVGVVGFVIGVFLAFSARGAEGGPGAPPPPRY